MDCISGAFLIVFLIVINALGFVLTTRSNEISEKSFPAGRYLWWWYVRGAKGPPPDLDLDRATYRVGASYMYRLIGGFLLVIALIIDAAFIVTFIAGTCFWLWRHMIGA